MGLVALVSAAVAGASAGQLTIVGAAGLVPVLAALAARGLSAGGRERAWEAEAVGVAALGVAWLWVAVGMTNAPDGPTDRPNGGCGRLVVPRMTRFMRASRGILVAVAILGLTAGIALAGRADPASHSMPDAAGPGLQRAADAAGKTVPVAAPAAGADRDAAGSDADQAAEDEAPDADTGAPAPDAAADHPANHGADVSSRGPDRDPDRVRQPRRSTSARSRREPRPGRVAASHANAASQGARPNH